MVKVSIIIPIYNKEEYLERCLDSVISQTLEDIEIILINDGSSDKSLEICHKYQEKDNRIKVINQKNSGVSIARNRGMKEASGEYIAFIDPDDYIEQNMYSSMYKLCEENKAEVCICNFYIHNDLGIRPVTVRPTSVLNEKEEIINQVVLNMLAPKDLNGRSDSMMGNVWRLLIRKESVNKNIIDFPAGIPLMEDLIFCIKLFSKTNKICFDSSYHYHYCIQGDSASIIYRENRYELQLEVIKILEELLKKENIYDIAKKRLNNRYINLGISSIMNESHSSNPKTLKNKIEKVKIICSQPEIYAALDSIDYSKYLLRKKLVLNAMKHKNALYLILYYRLVNKFKK